MVELPAIGMGTVVPVPALPPALEPPPAPPLPPPLVVSPLPPAEHARTLQTRDAGTSFRRDGMGDLLRVSPNARARAADLDTRRKRRIFSDDETPFGRARDTAPSDKSGRVETRVILARARMEERIATADFGHDPALTFLNHGSFGACPLAVMAEQDRLRRHFERDPVAFVVREQEAAFDGARASVASLLGARAE